MGKPNVNLQVLVGIQKNVKNKKWLCTHYGCNEEAIISHLLQQNGILDSIVEDGHAVLVKRTDPYRWNEHDAPIEFKVIGRTFALSTKLFCNNHDTQLFQPIEAEVINPYDYKTQLLLSYRTTSAERRTKEIIIEEFTRVANSLTATNDFKKQATDFCTISNVGLRDIDFYRKQLWTDIEQGTKNFTFHVYEYPKIDVCSSASFTLCDDISKNADLTFTLPVVFSHIIPINDKTYFIFGHHNEHTSCEIEEFIASWKNLNMDTLGEKLTQLFAFRTEVWAMSKTLYSKIGFQEKNDFLQLIGNEIPKFTHPIKTMNLFDGLLGD
jgi:hypothetical protein